MDEMVDESIDDDLDWASFVEAFVLIPDESRIADEEYQRQELLGLLINTIDPNPAILYENGKGEVWRYSGIELRAIEHDTVVLAFHDEPCGEHVRRPGWSERLEGLLEQRFGDRIRVVVEH